MLLNIAYCLYVVVVTSFVDAAISKEGARAICREGLRLACLFMGGLIALGAAVYIVLALVRV